MLIDTEGKGREGGRGLRMGGEGKGRGGKGKGKAREGKGKGREEEKSSQVTWNIHSVQPMLSTQDL